MTISTSVSEYWEEMSKGVLSDEEINLFYQKVDWVELSKFGSLSHQSWMKYNDYICFDPFSTNASVNPRTYNSLRKRVNWEFLATTRPIIDDELLLFFADYFSSLLFFKANPSAKLIHEETWERLLERNHSRLSLIMMDVIREEKERFLCSQLLSMDALDAYENVWSNQDWKIISIYQPVSFAFAKKYILSLHTKLLFEFNTAQQLSKSEVDELIEYISFSYDEQIEKGGSVSWEELANKHKLTPSFQRKYFNELSPYLKKERR